MKSLLFILSILSAAICDSQELDIFQNDSIYSKNKISVRTMYEVNGSTLQKKIVTHYNSLGQIIKQFWYWNGEKNFHNFETYYYFANGLLSSFVDSFADANVETTTFFYDKSVLQKRITLNNSDTIDFRSYPNKSTTIQCWYMSGKSYRFDTTIFERENVKLEYFGLEKRQNSDKIFKWHYKFKNEFDDKGNIIRITANVEIPYKSFTNYFYDERGLLLKKQETIFMRKEKSIENQYYFIYD